MTRYADPQAIEQQLRKLQKEISPNEAKTSLFNLVVYVDDHSDRPLMEALNTLHGKRPARVIVIRRLSSGETSTEVTARCVTDAQDNVLCIQEIVIFSGADKAGEVPEAWIPLLIREIPVYVWWLCGLEQAPVPQLFEDNCDRCFIDTAVETDPLGFYQGFARRIDSLKTPVTDFSWIRIAPLMKLVAQLFNPLEMRPNLHQLASLEVEGGEPAEILLFFQWLKTKMDWQGSPAATGIRWQLQGNAGPISFRHHHNGPLADGFQLNFKTQSGLEFALHDSREGYAQINGTGITPYTAVFRGLSPGEILIQETDRNTSDRLYLEVLHHWS